MKLLLWAAIVLLVIWILRGKKRVAETDAQVPSPSRQSTLDEGEVMLSCVHCGIHFPASEAVPGPADTVFCSDEHRRQHATH